jgi:ABC-type molybdenum transport system ATPase subunit/photorepair protein PhrA
VSGVPAVIEASAVTVRRGRRVVLSDVSLAVGAGQVAHLAGANGSGKTSLLRRLHTITGRELIACASCLVLATALMVTGTRWARVRG